MGVGCTGWGTDEAEVEMKEEGKGEREKATGEGE